MHHCSFLQSVKLGRFTGSQPDFDGLQLYYQSVFIKCKCGERKGRVRAVKAVSKRCSQRKVECMSCTTINKVILYTSTTLDKHVLKPVG